MRKAVLLAAAIGAALFFFLLATLPPRPFEISLAGVDPALRSRTVAAAYHIHTNRSDGGGTKADVAAAAARAGIKVALFTDHGDGTAPPDPPAYIDGVLCIDGVEISTDGGHYVALGMAAAPYPLGGSPSAVVEDVGRLGGFGVAAHPDHPTEELAWRDWTAPIDALEWINGDAQWRDERPVRLARVFFDYLVRPPAAVASVFDRPVATLERWDSLEKTRSIVALAAVDAHGAGGARAAGEGEGAIRLGTSYESSLRALSNRLVLERPLSGEPNEDARLAMDAIRQGRVYSVVDAISSDVLLELSHDRGFHAASALPAEARTYTMTQGDRRRIEVHAARAPGHPPVPWVLSNWAGRRVPPPPAAPQTRASEEAPLALASEWRVESDAESSGRVSGAGNVFTLEFRLRAGARASQFAAAVADLREIPDFSGLRFSGRASKPLRVSVQLRFAPDDTRWRRSVYLATEERDVLVPLSGMTATESRREGMPDRTRLRSILFVVDLVNGRPGETGSFTISGLRAVR